MLYEKGSSINSKFLFRCGSRSLHFLLVALFCLRDIFHRFFLLKKGVGRLVSRIVSGSWLTCWPSSPPFSLCWPACPLIKASSLVFSLNFWRWINKVFYFRRLVCLIWRLLYCILFMYLSFFRISLTWEMEKWRIFKKKKILKGKIIEV